MSQFQGRRVLIASLFLPVTVVQDENANESNLGSGSLRPPLNKQTSILGAKPHAISSILDDLATKSKVGSPIATPAIEKNSPFFAGITITLSQAASAAKVAAAPIADAISSLTGVGGAAQPQTPPRPKSRTSPRAARLSSSDSPWVIVPSSQGNGGLQNAINSVSDRVKTKLWIGVVGQSVDELADGKREELAQELRYGHDSIPVWIPNDEISSCYDGFCHQVLWPTLHYAVPDAPKTKSFYESTAFDQFASVNQKFADAIVAEYKPGDIIWINDYHLMLVPQLVRAKLPDAIIGFFLHVAWPSSELFRCLAVRDKLLRGVLGADLIGLQTQNFARHFRNGVSRILALEAVPKGIQLEGRFVDVDVFPMGIDVESLTKKRLEPEVAEWVAALQQKYQGMKLLVGRDKLDEVQGVKQKLLAFERFLETNPEFCGKVVLIQVALMTSEESELHSRVSDVVARINGRFSTLTYEPIVFLHTNELTFSQYLALLKVADAFVVTSLREGMALRAHEFVACQEDRKRPLILSEFTGSYTFNKFRSCIPINPWDRNATCEAIKLALTMSDEEAASRWKDLHGHVVTQSAQSFVTTFLSRVVRAHGQHQHPPLESIPVLTSARLVESLRPSSVSTVNRARLVLLDLEGSMWDRDPRSRSEVIPRDTLDAVQRLSDSEGIKVWLFSGLSKGVLQKALGELFTQVGLCAENGCFIKPPATGDGGWISMVKDWDSSWKPSALEILHYYTERTPGSFVVNSDVSITWRFWSNEQEHDTERVWAQRQAAEAQNHIWDSLGEKFGLRIVPRTNSFLVLPNKISRSTAVGAVLKMYGMTTQPEAAEDAFPLPKLVGEGTGIGSVIALSRDERLLARVNRVPGALTCSVSRVSTAAQYRLQTPQEVLYIVSEIPDTLAEPK